MGLEKEIDLDNNCPDTELQLLVGKETGPTFIPPQPTREIRIEYGLESASTCITSHNVIEPRALEGHSYYALFVFCIVPLLIVVSRFPISIFRTMLYEVYISLGVYAHHAKQTLTMAPPRLIGPELGCTSDVFATLRRIFPQCLTDLSFIRRCSEPVGGDNKHDCLSIEPDHEVEGYMRYNSRRMCYDKKESFKTSQKSILSRVLFNKYLTLLKKSKRSR